MKIKGSSHFSLHEDSLLIGHSDPLGSLYSQLDNLIKELVINNNASPLSLINTIQKTCEFYSSVKLCCLAVIQMKVNNQNLAQSNKWVDDGCPERDHAYYLIDDSCGISGMQLKINEAAGSAASVLEESIFLKQLIDNKKDFTNLTNQDVAEIMLLACLDKKTHKNDDDFDEDEGAPELDEIRRFKATLLNLFSERHNQKNINKQNSKQFDPSDEDDDEIPF